MIVDNKLVKIVGTGNMIREQTTLKEYSQDMSFITEVKPECVVKPKSAADIEKIVKLANETQTPLVPVSSGPPHFRGYSPRHRRCRHCRPQRHEKNNQD